MRRKNTKSEKEVPRDVIIGAKKNLCKHKRLGGKAVTKEK